MDKRISATRLMVQISKSRRILFFVLTTGLVCPMPVYAQKTGLTYEKLSDNMKKYMESDSDYVVNYGWNYAYEDFGRRTIGGDKAFICEWEE